MTTDKQHKPDCQLNEPRSLFGKPQCTCGAESAVSDAYSCNHCGAELIAAATYCGTECKIADLRDALRQKDERIAELEKNPLNMTRVDIHCELDHLRARVAELEGYIGGGSLAKLFNAYGDKCEQVAALTAPVDDAEIETAAVAIKALAEKKYISEKRVFAGERDDLRRHTDTLLRYARQQKARGDALAGYAQELISDIERVGELPVYESAQRLAELLEDEK